MKKIQILLSGFILLLVLQTCNHPEGLKLYQVDPLKKVLKEQTYFRDEPDTIRVAKGEYATIQIVAKGLCDVKEMKASVKEIKSGDGSTLSGATAGWVGYVHVGRSYYPPSSVLLRSTSDFFPDPILTDSAFSIENGEVQPLWITVPIDLSAQAGSYKGTVEISGLINGKKQTWKKDFFLKVYPVTMGKSPLYITNWSAHFNPVSLSYLNDNETVEIYSPLYWELIEMHAEIMASHRQNVHRIYPVWHTQYTLENGKYTFDFSRFDKETDIFDKAGALELIEGGHLAWRSGAWNSPFYVEVPVTDNEESRKLIAGINPLKVENGIRFVKLPVGDPRTQNFLNQFLPALKEHLEKKGWLDRYTQHIADEPTPANAGSYGEISNYIRKYMPGVRLLDAVLTSKELAGTIDIWIPELDILHKDFAFYQQLQKDGKEVWFYTCVGPRGNYANRFIEQPLLQTRYLHWINYKYNVTGYLHWGLNYWIRDQLDADASRDGGKLPAGDNCIIYPGYKKLYSSIRFESMRDGIDDYRLLKMLEEKKPDKAKSLANSIIQNFDQYDGSIRHFRIVRKQLLEALSN
jgi:hypothetical protein